MGLFSNIDVEGEALIAGSEVSGGDIALNAKQGVYVVGMHDETMTSESKSKSYTLSGKQSLDTAYKRKVVKGGLNASGKLDVNSEEGEVLVVGSDITAGNGLNINAKDGIAFINDLDVSETYSESSESAFFDFNKGFNYKKKETKHDYKETVVGSDITSGADMALRTDGAIQKIGGSLSVAGDAELTADSIEFAAATAKSYSKETVEESAFGGISFDTDISKLSGGMSINTNISKSETETSKVSVDSGENLIGGNLTMTSKNDINIVGTTVAANGDIDADATILIFYQLKKLKRV